MYMELRPEGGARIHKVLCTHMDRTSSKPLSPKEHSPAPSRAASSEADPSPFGRCCTHPMLIVFGVWDGNVTLDGSPYGRCCMRPILLVFRVPG